MSELDDKTKKLIEEISRTRNDLFSNIYDDFYGAGKEKLPGNAGTGTGAPAGDQLGSGSQPGSGGQSVTGGQPSAGSQAASGDPSAEGKTQSAAAAAAEGKQAEPEEDPMETLDKLIGLDKIKEDVKELAAFAKVQKDRKDAGMKTVPISMHLVFTGNPGTGKTTVARILAKIYKNIGVLPTGQLVETDRSGLVAGYVGQTAIKTQGMISKAMGGVLFIDEAYALSQKDDAFGQEAIDTLLKAMEDHRDELVVIVAGYTEPMEKFINSNPGLKSRFNKYFEFPDYTSDELIEIFKLDCKKYDYTIDDDTLKHVRELIAARRLVSLDNFANAREVRNLFETIITNQARRVAGLKDPTREQMMEILPEDLLDKPADLDDKPDGLADKSEDQTDKSDDGKVEEKEEKKAEEEADGTEAADIKK